MDGVIRAHCMGMEFPKRDTDGPNVRWGFCSCGKWPHEDFCWLRTVANSPFAADLDAVAEERRIKEKTGG